LLARRPTGDHAHAPEEGEKKKKKKKQSMAAATLDKPLAVCSQPALYFGHP
jgi:hypothetical protein